MDSVAGSLATTPSAGLTSGGDGPAFAVEPQTAAVGARPAAAAGALPPPLAVGALLLVGSVVGLALLARPRATATTGATAAARDGQTGAIASHRRIEML